MSEDNELKEPTVNEPVLEALLEAAAKVEEVAVSKDTLAENAFYVGIEMREDGYVVVFLNKQGDSLLKRDEYRATKNKAEALHGFRMAAGGGFIQFANQNLKLKKKES